MHGNVPLSSADSTITTDLMRNAKKESLGNIVDCLTVNTWGITITLEDFNVASSFLSNPTANRAKAALFNES